jgi:hypothetical protein
MTAHQAKPLSSVLIGTLARMQLPLMLAVAGLLVVALPADAGDIPCLKPYPIERGDHLRLLRVYVCGYSNDSGIAERGRIVMRTYRWTTLPTGEEGWYPVTSQSITLHDAEFYTVESGSSRRFGQKHGGNCRVGSPAGSIGCSVPSTHDVTFYGPALDVPAGWWVTVRALGVAWRDDQGYPHPPEGYIGIYVAGPTWQAK